MARDIGNLVTVIIVGRIGHIYRPLERILQTPCDIKLGQWVDCEHSADINAFDIDKPEIQHRPSELLSFRVRYDFVFDLVVIYVCRHLHSRDQPS